MFSADPPDMESVKDGRTMRASRYPRKDTVEELVWEYEEKQGKGLKSIVLRHGEGPEIRYPPWILQYWIGRHCVANDYQIWEKSILYAGAVKDYVALGLLDEIPWDGKMSADLVDGHERTAELAIYLTTDGLKSKNIDTIGRLINQHAPASQQYYETEFGTSLIATYRACGTGKLPASLKSASGDVKTGKVKQLGFCVNVVLNGARAVGFVKIRVSLSRSRVAEDPRNHVRVSYSP